MYDTICKDENQMFKNFSIKVLLFHSHCAKLYLHSCQSNRAIPLLLFVYKAVTRNGVWRLFVLFMGKSNNVENRSLYIFSWNSKHSKVVPLYDFSNFTIENLKILGYSQTQYENGSKYNGKQEKKMILICPVTEEERKLIEQKMALLPTNQSKNTVNETGQYINAYDIIMS